LLLSSSSSDDDSDEDDDSPLDDVPEDEEPEEEEDGFARGARADASPRAAESPAALFAAETIGLSSSDSSDDDDDAVECLRRRCGLGAELALAETCGGDGGESTVRSTMALVVFGRGVVSDSRIRVLCSSLATQAHTKKI